MLLPGGWVGHWKPKSLTEWRKPRGGGESMRGGGVRPPLIRGAGGPPLKIL